MRCSRSCATCSAIPRSCACRHSSAGHWRASSPAGAHRQGAGIYDKIGGASPILGQTEAQARALEDALGQGDGKGHEWRGYVCMRYWHPMTEAVVRSVARFAPDRIVLLPLYPQFSTTTTASSFKAWNDTATFKVPTGS